MFMLTKDPKKGCDTNICPPSILATQRFQHNNNAIYA